MPRKIRELIRDLRDAGFYEISGAGKDSHRKFSHQHFPGAVTLSGGGDDARPYQEKQVRQASSECNMKTSDQFHKWVEWSEEDQTYLGMCPDLITGIHGDDPVQLYAELCEVVDDVIRDFEQTGRTLPTPRTRPVQEAV